MNVNKARGEAKILIDGQERRLCLTLGALAEMETAFAVGSLQELADRLRSLSANDLLIVLRALLKGGGSSDEWVAALNGQKIDLVEAANVVADCFSGVA